MTLSGTSSSPRRAPRALTAGLAAALTLGLAGPVVAPVASADHDDRPDPLVYTTGFTSPDLVGELAASRALEGRTPTSFRLPAGTTTVSTISYLGLRPEFDEDGDVRPGQGSRTVDVTHRPRACPGTDPSTGPSTPVEVRLLPGTSPTSTFDASTRTVTDVPLPEGCSGIAVEVVPRDPEVAIGTYSGSPVLTTEVPTLPVPSPRRDARGRLVVFAVVGEADLRAVRRTGRLPSGGVGVVRYVHDGCRAADLLRRDLVSAGEAAAGIASARLPRSTLPALLPTVVSTDGRPERTVWGVERGVGTVFAAARGARGGGLCR